jgi:hypothetical protein
MRLDHWHFKDDRLAITLRIGNRGAGSRRHIGAVAAWAASRSAGLGRAAVDTPSSLTAANARGDNRAVQSDATSLGAPTAS